MSWLRLVRKTGSIEAGKLADFIVLDCNIFEQPVETSYQTQVDSAVVGGDILSQSGHSAWVNSKALELAGVDESVNNVGSYIFDRYDGTNEPSGTARDNGMVLIMNALHYLSPEDFAPFFETELERYSKYGVTAIQPAEGSITCQFGSIEVGKSADMVILDQNLLGIAQTDIHKTKVQKTIFRGEVVSEP